ncbi:hypothetical protein GQ457_03G009640 [Hibiscus cannabinus]
MATIIETYEANTRMMKQNSEMLQEILRQVKSLAAHLSIVDEGQINDAEEVMVEEDNPNPKSHQVLDKLSTPTHPKINAKNCDEELGDEQIQSIQDIEGFYPRKEKATSQYQFEQRPPFFVTIHIEPWKPLVITEVVEIATGGGPRTMTTYSVSNFASTYYFDRWLKKLFNETQVVKVDDSVLFRLLVMERIVDLCQKFHQVLDRLPTTIDPEVDKQPIESSDDPSMFRLLVMERMVDLCDRNLKIKVTKNISTNRSVKYWSDVASVLVGFFSESNLGTTCSLVGVGQQDGAEIKGNEQGKRMTPSYVGVNESDRLISDAAKYRVIWHTIYEADSSISQEFEEFNPGTVLIVGQQKKFEGKKRVPATKEGSKLDKSEDEKQKE